MDAPGVGCERFRSRYTVKVSKVSISKLPNFKKKRLVGCHRGSSLGLGLGVAAQSTFQTLSKLYELICEMVVKFTTLLIYF